MSNDLHNELTLAELIPCDVYTSTETGSGVDISQYTGSLKIILHSDQGTGNADNTLNVKVQDSADDSTYADISGATFTEVDDTAGGALEAIKLDTRATNQYIRIIGTLAGTSVSFAFGVSFVGRKALV